MTINKKQVPTALDYNNGDDDLPEGAFRISPSSFSSFMSYPHQWYREKLLGEEGFTGNTSSVIGTIVHYCAECYAKDIEINKEEIEQYISNHQLHPDVETSIVRSQWLPMAETLINDYVRYNKPTEVEPFVKYELQPGYFPSGSIDNITGDIIVDYKTYNSKTKPRGIPQNYKYQLLIYAYICRKLGKQIDRIRLVYVNRTIDGTYISDKTGKQCGKIHPPEVTVFTEMITQDDMDFIESLLNLCIESVMKVKEDPSLAYLIFRDYRLKEK